MKKFLISAFFATTCILPGCGRDAPPQIPDFKPPLAVVEVESTVPEAIKEESVASAMPTPMQRQKRTIAKTVETPTPVPQITAAPKQDTKGPSIIGSWQISEMEQGGRTMPMPPGIQMILTFEEGGTVSMSMSGGPPQAQQSRQGTYSLNNDQITLNIDREALTGTCTFEGNTKVTLDFTKVKMVLTRM